MVKCFNPYSPGFSIYLKNMNIYEKLSDGFNPYSPGFSIYLEIFDTLNKKYELLQSLFTWIFYLFNQLEEELHTGLIASILIHLDFLSIFY